ncbi:MAG: hypothetical protein H0W30_10840 [Gemmatimonadaceae bacterium]|nr:hypothetical protein [Gemmatimonadaceae bacterium]
MFIDLAGINYDLAGNLTALQRYRETATLIDNLAYTYPGTSNRLSSVSERCRELKPNNPRAIRKGEKQVREYCRECDKTIGPGHTGRVVTYTP